MKDLCLSYTGIFTELNISGNLFFYRCQMVFLEEMSLPSDAVHNTALCENAFMIAVCVENRLPLFLIGKPGSSKSLAKSICMGAMLGQNSPSRLFSNFKQVQMFPYLCSQYTTSTSIIDVFRRASEFQEAVGHMVNFVSVVVLEQVGLAEASPGLPLKTLHPYLEDGTAGFNTDEEEIPHEKRVAFVGISNWDLDPAKMNRAIVVTSVPPDEDELTVTAKGIEQSLSQSVSMSLESYFKPLALMYQDISKRCTLESQTTGINQEFFGLQDFYSLIKMLCVICMKSQKPITYQQLQYAVLRNFSGLEGINPMNFICNLTAVKRLCRDPEPNEPQPNCTHFGLVSAALKSFQAFLPLEW